ncbi:uncharacterized protein V1477_011627 [Vespula maculifrons]|uniref:Uncharacterized protein n=4 Tax=Vespula TaxID=7451 RepID=A0A834JK30_VESGE|nr:uncharacterized protein LOC127068536 [Vespula vulgaris]KAF7386868.1 hypothetical protein HZH66_011320 [Vespula vulgaris]KAF7388587.1 hypothetical protein HZH68_012529 [Vespula germanica]
MNRVEFITPWVQMRAQVEHIHKWKHIAVTPKPFAPRHSITFFNNKKQEKKVTETVSAYDRLHKYEDFDPRKPRAECISPSLIWSEIYEENKHHIVPMITSHWYGRPNREQIDYPDKSLCHASQIREFYRRNDLNLVADEIREFQMCYN